MVIEIALGIILAFIIIASVPILVRVALFLLPVGLVAYVVWYISHA